MELDPIQQALHEDVDWYRDLVEHSRDLLCTHDLQGRLISVNAASALLLGYNAAQLVKRSMRDLLAPEFRSHLDLYLDQLQREGHASGYMVVVTRTGERRIWYYHSTLRTEGVAAPIVRGAAHDVTEQKRAISALEESENRFRLLFEKAPVGICLVDIQTGRFLKANSKFCEIVGRQEEDLWALDVSCITHLDDIPASVEKMRQLRAGEIQQFELEKRYVRPDGSIRWVSVSAVQTSSQGECPPLNMATVQDITDHRQTDETLRETESRARQQARDWETLFDAVPIPVLIARDASCRYITTNRAGNELLRVGSGANALLSAPENDRPTFRLLRDRVELPASELPMQQAHATGKSVLRSPLQVKFEDGETRDVIVNAAPLIGESGAVEGVIGAFIDITERKEAERALRASEERFRSLVRASAQIVWSSPADGKQSGFANPEWQEFTGQSRLETAGDGWADAIHPDDRERTLAAWETAVANGSVYEVENRIRRHDGVYRHMLGRAVPVQDASGRITEWVGMNSDITERKEAEEELRRAKEKLADEKLYLEHAIDTELGFGEIIGQSRALKVVMEQVRQVASSDATVLLLGETGTGKELVARAIHRLSQREGNSFIKMNCAAIPTGLLESELFGHEKGAFTGAVSRKVGRIELADQGTLFLDEIGEIPLVLQPKLLRVLQDQEFERLGGTHTLRVNFRLIAATNRDLSQLIKEKQFRSDLYYRLNVFPIHLPPLRERRDDIRPLVEHFVRRSASQMKRTITSIPKKTMDALVQWDWPGNIRELENFIERSVILSQGSVLVAPISELVSSNSMTQPNTLEAAEREHILKALRESRGQLSGLNGAATRLGLPRSTLQWKIKQLGIDHLRFRD